MYDLIVFLEGPDGLPETGLHELSREERILVLGQHVLRRSLSDGRNVYLVHFITIFMKQVRKGMEWLFVFS